MFALQADGMTCGGCARRVTTAVLSADASAKVDVDLAAKLVWVDSGADAQAVARAVTAAGYPASLVSGA